MKVQVTSGRTKKRSATTSFNRGRRGMGGRENYEQKEDMRER